MRWFLANLLAIPFAALAALGMALAFLAFVVFLLSIYAVSWLGGVLSDLRAPPQERWEGPWA